VDDLDVGSDRRSLVGHDGVDLNLLSSLNPHQNRELARLGRLICINQILMTASKFTFRGVMVKYYFDIRGDGPPARDHVGRDFDIPSTAIAYARELADGLRIQKAFGQNMRVCVVSESGLTVYEENWTSLDL
jgi:hypothetical protein